MVTGPGRRHGPVPPSGPASGTRLLQARVPWNEDGGGSTATRAYRRSAAPADRVGGRYSRTYVRSQHAPVSRSSRQVVYR